MFLMDDACLDYMDKDERLEAMLLRELQTSFHKMVHVLEIEGGQGKDTLPSFANILMFGLS